MFEKGHTPWNKGKVGILTEEQMMRMSNALRGRVAWNKGKIGCFTEESRENESCTYRTKISFQRSAQKN